MKKALLIILLLLVPDVLALGIAPARKTIDFQPEEQQELQYRVYNSDRQAFTARITLSPELDEIADVEPETIQFNANDAVKTFNLILSFDKKPPEFEDGKITISGETTSQAPVSASVQISAQVNIQTTGAVVGDGAAVEEPRNWTKWTLGILIGVLILVNVVYFTFGRNERPTKKTPEVNPELEQAKEIEEEIDHLRHMR